MNEWERDPGAPWLAGAADDDDDDDDGAPRVQVALATYVSVHATVASGIPLAAALAAHGIAEDAWLDIDADFAERLADSVDDDDGALLDEYDRLLAELRDAQPRAIDPLDDDLPAFLDFVRNLAALDEPWAHMEERGLGLADLALLQRRWASRLDERPDLRRLAVELLARDPGPMPEVHVAPALALLPAVSASATPENAPVFQLHAPAGEPARRSGDRSTGSTRRP